MWNNTGPNLIYFSTSSCLSLGQIELIKYLQFSFTLASSNSVELPFGSEKRGTRIIFRIREMGNQNYLSDPRNGEPELSFGSEKRGTSIIFRIRETAFFT